MESTVCIEAEYVGGADGIVGVGDLLGFVDEVWEGEAVCFREDLHVVEAVFGVVDCVVRHDGGEAYALGLQGFGVGDEAVDDGFDVGAVIADEGDDCAFFAFDVAQGEGLAVDVFEAEVRGLEILGGLRGMHEGHSFSPVTFVI